MNILFDQGTPVPLRRHLQGHSVTTTYEQGWSSLTNGQLLAQAEQAGIDLLITTDSESPLPTKPEHAPYCHSRAPLHILAKDTNTS